MVQVLLTGFPGFLAEASLKRCKEAGRAVFWHLIVLPDQVSSATEKLRRLDLTVSEYALYPGDITKPDMGLPKEDAQKIQNAVERCFHLAALNDLSERPGLLDKVNVWGTRQVIEFLRLCPNLRKFNCVSTCYVSGALEGDIAEDALPQPPAFRNEQERSKYEAEQLVRAALEEIPTTIFRPAMIVGSSQTGETVKFDGPYVLIRFFRWGQRLFYSMPNLGFDSTYYNCIPVDFVATVLAEVGFSDDFTGKTLHVADPNPPSVAESFAAIYHQVSGRECFEIGDRLKRFILRVCHFFPFDLLTGVPSRSLDYFRHAGRYQTDNLEAACGQSDIEIPRWPEFYKPVIKFALVHRRYTPNAAVISEFKRWCSAFRFIYAITGVAFLFFPRLLVYFLTLLDSDRAAATMLTDNLLWRPLGVSLIVGLFVAVTSLERNPFQKPLHILIIGGKFVSAGLYFAFALYYLGFSLFICGLIDAFIGLTHLLFYYRLKRVQPMAASEYHWNPYDLMFPERFIADFVDAMTPEFEEPIDIPAVVDQIRAYVRNLPFVVRYGFLLVCYQNLLLMPIFCGLPPYILMDRDQRDRFFKRAQHVRWGLLRLPLMFVKMTCAIFLFKQESFLRSIGAK